jgi:integrase
VRQLKIPKLSHHKNSGQGVVRLNGKDHYLGKFGDPETKRKYDTLIAEWLANRRQSFAPDATQSAKSSITVAEGILHFWRHAEQHYRHPDGTPTSELGSYRYVLKVLRELYSELPIDDFSPLKFKPVRQQMIEKEWSRKLINQQCGRIKRMFKFLVSEELCSPTVFEGLRAVAGLQQGRTEARETEPVTPVTQDQIDAVLPRVTPTVAAMIQFQLLTGCRPGEVCSLRLSEIDRTSEIWVFSPSRHKLSWRGKRRTILIGPKAQELLKPYLENRDPEAFVFSPREAKDAFQQSRASKRKSKRQPSQLKRKRKARPRRQPGDRYTTHSYGQAIEKACKKAGVPRPVQKRCLRHSGRAAILPVFCLCSKLQLQDNWNGLGCR